MLILQPNDRKPQGYSLLRLNPQEISESDYHLQVQDKKWSEFFFESWFDRFVACDSELSLSVDMWPGWLFEQEDPF